MTPTYSQAESGAKLVLRRAVPSDFETVDRLHAASIRELAAGHYDADTIRDWSMSLDRDVFERAVASTEYRVGVVDGEVVAAGQLDLDACEIKMLYVDPRWVEKGVGGRLLEELETRARESGLARLVLRSSLNAEPFYHRAGWNATERTTHTLRTGREVDCVWMAKEL